MRVTITLEPDVLAAVEEMRRSRGIGASEAVNKLARRGIALREPSRERFVQRTHDMGAFLIPIDDIAAALGILEGDDHS